jgi:DNA-binding response OmpR family regulator
MVEDEPLLIRATQRALRGKMNVVGIENGDAAIETLRSERFDAILAEVSILDSQGQSFVTRVESEHTEYLPRLLIASGGREAELVQHFAASHGCPVLHKPVDTDMLLAAVDAIRSSHNEK